MTHGDILNNYRFVILVVEWCGESHTVKFSGAAKALKELSYELYRRYHPQYMEVSDRKTHRTLRYRF